MNFLIYVGEGLKIAFQALRSYKMRSTLTTLGVVIGVTTVITIVTLVQGLNTAFKSELSSIGTNTLYINKYPWVIMSQEEWIRVRNRPNITMQEAEKIKDWSQYAAAVAPTLDTRRNAKYRERSIKDVSIIGTTADYLLTSNTFPEKGRFLSSVDVDHRRAVCVLGQDVVDELFPYTDPLGKRVNLGDVISP
ncbi:MAG: ABC transporter permease [candidate division KSB1 bacterium]|nr:ABC transporter permease [candidate division KSB1 bacterium]